MLSSETPRVRSLCLEIRFLVVHIAHLRKDLWVYALGRTRERRGRQDDVTEEEPRHASSSYSTIVSSKKPCLSVPSSSVVDGRDGNSQKYRMSRAAERERERNGIGYLGDDSDT